MLHLQKVITLRTTRHTDTIDYMISRHPTAGSWLLCKVYRSPWKRLRLGGSYELIFCKRHAI